MNLHRNRRILAGVMAAAVSFAAFPAGADELVLDEGGIEVPAPQVDENDQQDPGEGLISDDGEQTVVQDGLSLEEAQQAEIAPESERIYFLEDGSLTLEGASRENIQNYMDHLLAAVNPTGSNAEMEMAAYIESVMKDFGYTVEEQSFHEGFLNADYVDVPGINIIAERGADSRERTKDILIVAAHYDAKTDPQEGDLLANDKGGAAVLLEAARILASVESDLDVCFLFLSGEEDGYYGSQRFAEHLDEQERQRIVGVITLDRVGFQAGDGVGAAYYLGLPAAEKDEECVLADELEKAAVQVKEDLTKRAVEIAGESEAQSEAETEAETSPDGRLLRRGWTAVEMPDKTSAQAFADLGLESVSIFQDLAENYTYMEETEVSTEPEEAISEAQSEEQIEMITESAPSARVFRAEQKESSEIWDLEALQNVTDVLARSIAVKMLASKQP